MRQMLILYVVLAGVIGWASIELILWLASRVIN